MFFEDRKQTQLGESGVATSVLAAEVQAFFQDKTTACERGKKR